MSSTINRCLRYQESILTILEKSKENIENIDDTLD
jgi:hypothetical protein